MFLQFASKTFKLQKNTEFQGPHGVSPFGACPRKSDVEAARHVVHRHRRDTRDEESLQRCVKRCVRSFRSVKNCLKNPSPCEGYPGRIGRRRRGLRAGGASPRPRSPRPPRATSRRARLPRRRKRPLPRRGCKWVTKYASSPTCGKTCRDGREGPRRRRRGSGRRGPSRRARRRAWRGRVRAPAPSRTRSR